VNEVNYYTNREEISNYIYDERILRYFNNLPNNQTKQKLLIVKYNNVKSISFYSFFKNYIKKKKMYNLEKKKITILNWPGNEMFCP